MIASLPMYDRPETQAANDRLWTLVRANSDDPLPPALTRGEDPWDHWQAPDLTLSQTCSLPYRARLHDKVALVGTPVYMSPEAFHGHTLDERSDVYGLGATLYHALTGEHLFASLSGPERIAAFCSVSPAAALTCFTTTGAPPRS